MVFEDWFVGPVSAINRARLRDWFLNFKQKQLRPVPALPLNQSCSLGLCLTRSFDFRRVDAALRTKARAIPFELLDSTMDLTTSILNKWKAQRTFIRFMDGNIHNLMVSNLQYVGLLDALGHIDDWKVDWDLELTPEEIALVRDPTWRAGLVFEGRK
jgi:hypothetical protein